MSTRNGCERTTLWVLGIRSIWKWSSLEANTSAIPQARRHPGPEMQRLPTPEVSMAAKGSPLLLFLGQIGVGESSFIPLK